MSFVEFEGPHRPAWHARAACRGLGTSLWFSPDSGDGGVRVHWNRLPGLRICAGCPVRAECLAAGMGEQYGLWGGKTRKQRRGLRWPASR